MMSNNTGANLGFEDKPGFCKSAALYEADAGVHRTGCGDSKESGDVGIWGVTTIEF